MTTVFRNNKIDGELKAQNETYIVRDYMDMDRLVLSSIVLHSGKETRGHQHQGQEEVYFFIFGRGTMVIGDSSMSVCAGDIAIVPDGKFHRVINNGETDLVFHTVYNKLEQPTTVYAR